MKLIRLNSLLEHGLGYDSETYLLRRGNLAPDPVCASAAWYKAEGPSIEGVLLDKDDGLELFVQALEDPDTILVGANVAFDILVMANECARRGLDAMPAIFQCLEEGRVYDVQLAEALNAIADGYLGKDPKTGGQLRDPITKKPGRYSLSICVDQVLGRADAKENDEWRLRYGELDGVPLEEWPEVARVYPVDDAKNTLECALAQVGHLPKLSPHHNWGPEGACTDCGASRLGVQCLVKRPHRNLHEVSNQVWTNFALHASAAWGFRVNQKSVDIIERHALKNKEGGSKPFVEAGIVRGDGTEDRSKLKREIAKAYGAHEVCAVCKGTGKVPSLANPKSKIVCFEVDPNGTKLKTCDGTGLILTDDVPRSDKEGISYGRDTLHESGNEFLMSYGDYLEDRKDLDYVEYLREAQDEEKNDITLVLRPNTVLETGRVSYSGYIQLFKRAPGYWDDGPGGTGKYVPSLRECIEARPGFLFSSEDYEAGELITHAQSCKWITGDSQLMWALLNGLKPHNALAATMIGMGYEEFQERLEKMKDPVCSDARQAAKPPNFGYPGGMGPVKLVHQQRKQGPNTPHPNGPNWVEDENGNKVRGYKGLRFCILMDKTDRCGGEGNMAKVWNDRPIPPTCVRCIECAVRLKKYWIKQWPENTPYFKFINDCVENGQLIDYAMITRWPHLAEVYKVNQRLGAGEILQHVSGRIRGGIDYCSSANGFFQGLLADACKSALRRISKECYVRGVRVPDMAHYNSKRSQFTGAKSPLFGSRPILFAHDEILLEHPESVASEGATRVSEIMVDELRVYCPDLADACAAEPTLMRRWLKQAKKVKSADGRLIPWEPAPRQVPKQAA